MKRVQAAHAAIFLDGTAGRARPDRAIVQFVEQFKRAKENQSAFSLDMPNPILQHMKQFGRTCKENLMVQTEKKSDDIIYVLS